MISNLNRATQNTRTAKILVFDRDASTGTLIHAPHGDVHFEVRQITKPANAERAALEFHPDVLVVSADWAASQPTSTAAVKSPATSFPGLADLISKLRKTDRHLPLLGLVDGSPDSTQGAIELLSWGASDCISKPIFVPKLSARIAAALEMRRHSRTPSVTRAGEQKPTSLSMIGKCDAMLAVFRSIGIAAAQHHAVMIRGESGSGKTLAAKLIHQQTRRPAANLVFVRCDEQSADRLESIVFGSAASGACDDTARLGPITTQTSSASSTTWVLENIDVAPLSFQHRLLEWIRDYRQGQAWQAAAPEQTVVMTIRTAFGDRNPSHAILPELFYELRGGKIDLPALRERGNDLELLVQHCVSEITGTQPLDDPDPLQGLTPDLLKMLRGYDWPGNITELFSVLRADLLAGNGVLGTGDYLQRLTQPDSLRRQPAAAQTTRTQTSHDYSSSEQVPSLSHSEQAMVAGKAQLQLRSTDYWAATVDALIDRAVKDGIDIAADIAGGSEPIASAGFQSGFTTHSETLDAVETGLIGAVLKRTGGNLTQSARLLGMTRVSLRKKIHALGLIIPGRGVST